ncbi:ATP-dependent RNA helicase [Encephalitozoon intestinalis ATCC 50506]|uniref:ATP-dependent RNA helicase n=1 Tax=Encephalitozoon intestinalis (strain ATCC 50506) TaxID=876142 RepID=E0S9I1_ENCIT|nr:ATP-dependent RNA helicase [Encephalitozoon intestinalis ATCC 50506]ADM12366.1 ATP-dependent RNA helicase [Encephalitozoon intestinalis ATCC 50506]UTX46198.1 DEAD box RNA helicase [Encephalitozoon intestinalis]
MEFDELNIDDSLVQACQRNGITRPTEIQKQVIPMVLGGNDIIAVSQTGSGKTLAFVLPIVSRLLLKNRSFFCLVVAPTRELSSQIAECFNMFGSTGLRVCLLVGGTNFNLQANQLSKHPHIVVGTPGRIAEHILKTKSFKAERIRKLVLDEADRFFEQDFVEDLETIIRSLREKRQTLLFTATMSNEISKLSSSILIKPKTIRVVEGYETVSALKEYYFFTAMKWKSSALVEFLEMNPGASTIVFVSMCITARVMSLALSKLGFHSEALYGELSQEKREETMRMFKENKFSVLVCTDVGSRGLDISHVDLVINFDVPKSGKDYVHRVGRTARAGRAGTAITLVTQYDVEQLQRVEFVLKKSLEEFKPVKKNFESIREKVEETIQEAQEILKGERKRNRRH